MVMNSRQRAALAALCPSTRWEVSMASHSTFRAGGVVEAMAEPADSGQLAALVRWLHREGVAWASHRRRLQHPRRQPLPRGRVHPPARFGARPSARTGVAA